MPEEKSRWLKLRYCKTGLAGIPPCGRPRPKPLGFFFAQKEQSVLSTRKFCTRQLSPVKQYKMFEDFSFAPSQKTRQQQRFYDPGCRIVTTGLENIDDGSISPTDSSSRGSSPDYYHNPLFSHNAPTSMPRLQNSNTKSARQTSVTELSQFFMRQTLQSRRRSSASSPTSIPFMLRSHDPTSLAILSNTHASRISRRRTSLQPRNLPCSPAHLDRVASLVEKYLDDGSGLAGSVRRRSDARDMGLEEPEDDEVHPSMMMEEEDDVPLSPTSYASPDEGLRSDGAYFALSSCVVPPTPPLLPGELPSGPTSRRNSYDKTIKPVRIRRKTVTKSRLSIGMK